MAAISAIPENRPRSGRRRLRRTTLALFDAGAWACALTAANWLRFEFDYAQVDLVGLLWMVGVAVAVLWSTGAATHLYSGRYPTGSLDEVLHVARATVLVALTVLVAASLATTPPVPRSVPLIAWPLALAILLAARLAVRSHRDRVARPNRLLAQRAIVYGAGRRGEQLVRAMLSGSAGNTLPVAVLDDDPALRHSRIGGVPVRGTGQHLAAVAKATGANLLIIAGPGQANARSALACGRDLGLDVKIMPALHELLRARVRVRDLRDLDVADLLGRRAVDTDLGPAADYLAGKTVLVTGAGGSIGSELCRQLHRLGSCRVLMLDRDESALHAVQLSIHAEARLDAPEVILGDIRDTEMMRAVLLARRPDVVFHAAALKHLPVLERYPDEAWKTNVLGTLDIVEAAQLAGVRRFVNISTDKAANPTSVLGRSKRIGERLVAAASPGGDGAYLSVRFGNVLGSRGSVLSTFTEQLAAGQPVTVTHPDVTRFFMTISEAVQLVIQAATIGSAGEVLVLDMGQPARIADLAEMLMTISGRRSRIVYTGLGQGEKLHEELFGDDEEDYRPIHPAISHVPVPPLAPEAVRLCGAELGSGAAMAVLVDDCPPPSPRRPMAANDNRIRIGVAQAVEEGGIA
ncbi:nucleoside-diphosphate sugar epimerase/dehydratase [Amycolatopsis sp. NPDC051128]|uniref:nucleoside-diphosphate sugar epimerase/dehydratase n=1 Tax=Amycolatopsis sp. NPDC051128 TaxID=3155412 RepID=UPI003441A54B